MAVIVDTPIIDASHVPSTEIELTTNEPFLSGVFGVPKRFHYLSRDKVAIARDVSGRSGDAARFEVATVSMGVQALHRCFATHTAFGLSPDVAWYLIAHEVTEHVKQHADDHRDLFTTQPEGKQEVVVRDDSLRYEAPSDWARSISLVRDPLQELLSEELFDLFLPTFSTSTEESWTAILVAFMDTISPYYEFEWATLCGIPQVRLEGTADDWSELVEGVRRLASRFTGLAGYFADLVPVLETIARRASGEQGGRMDFWRSIYKYEDESGGPYVTGWINAFFAHVQTSDGLKLKDRFDWAALGARRDGYPTNAFPSHVSRVPFVWNYLGTHIPMSLAAGIFGVDFTDGFLTPKLGFAVIED